MNYNCKFTNNLLKYSFQYSTSLNLRVHSEEVLDKVFKHHENEMRKVPIKLEYFDTLT